MVAMAAKILWLLWVRECARSLSLCGCFIACFPPSTNSFRSRNFLSFMTPSVLVSEGVVVSAYLKVLSKIR